MARLDHLHRGVIRYGSAIAEHIVKASTRCSLEGRYDVKTLDELSAIERQEGTFAKLMRLESDRPGRAQHYRICLQDKEILDFLHDNAEVDMLTFLVFVMTHELIHMHRFDSGQADFYTVKYDEEVLVDAITRLFMAKHPLPGRKKVLTLLDKVTPAPLYNLEILVDQGGSIHAYL